METNGLEALINQDRGVSNLKNWVDEATEQAVLAYAVEYSAHGPHRTGNEYTQKRDLGKTIRYGKNLNQILI